MLYLIFAEESCVGKKNLIFDTCVFYNVLFSPYRYEGRCGLPSNFDSTYCYALGYAAGVLLHSGKTGLISSVSSSIFFRIQSFLVMY